MERIALAVQNIRSFSYQMSNKSDFPPTADKPARTHHDDGLVFWRAPAPSEPDQFGDFHATSKIATHHHLPNGQEQAIELTNIVEIHPTGEPGILIDNLAKRYFHVPPLHVADIARSTPLLWLRAVREKAGVIVDDLGSRIIDGREARGYIMRFDDSDLFRDYSPVEVWIDPQTDLPMEFNFRYAKSADQGFVDKYSVTNIQWNIDLDPQLFNATPPSDFIDITLSNDERSIAEILAALKQYATLSGGHYPLVEKTRDRNYVTRFDAEKCMRKMLRMGGFIGPQQDQWTADPKYQRILKSRAGLESLERVLSNPRWLVGYYGSEVTAIDKDQALLWWNVATENDKDEYRLVYGDLRTESVRRQKWLQFVPPEIAEMTE
jgi:hypothetical protein